MLKIKNPLQDEFRLCTAAEQEFDAGSYFRMQREYSYEVPTDQVIQAISSRFDKLVEIGAGSGYWAYVLSQAGVDVAAFDVNVGNCLWYAVEQGSAEVLHRYADRALLLCWPPFDDDMAASCLKQFMNASGKDLIFVGESRGGCVANDSFFDLYYANFDTVESIAIRDWPLTCMEISTRKSEGSHK